MLAADQTGEIFALLLVIAPAADLVDAEVRVGAVAEAHRRRCARHLLLRHNMLEIAEAESTPLLLDRDSVEAQLAHLRPQVLREFVVFIDFRSDRSDLLARAPLGRLADRVGHFAEVEIESGIGHCRSPVHDGASRGPSV